MAAEEQEPAFEIDDPEELSQKTRIKELLSRRTSVIDARDQAFDAMTLGQATQEQARAFYQRRIESLIIDLWTQFQNEDIDAGTKYLFEETIDTVEVPPPAELQDAENMAPGESIPQPKKEPIRGLFWFVNNEPIVAAEFTAHTWDPPGQSTYIAERPVPARTLDKALMKCMEFIDETGIDINVRQDQGDHGFDYSDILENGPPGQADDMTPEEIKEYGNE